MEKLPLAIGILSWGQHATLLNTLQSYERYGLLDIAAQIFVFFQEISDEDIRIAESFGLEVRGSLTNLGIAGGYRMMLEYVDQPKYLFLENDWAIMHPPKRPPKESIEEGWFYLNNNAVDVVRYRSRQYPGNPLWTRQFEGRELSRLEHLLDSIHWIEHPDEQFGQIKKWQKGWYCTTAPYANWTNNPHMVRTEWAKKVLLPRLGDKDIESDLQSWWQTQPFRVLQGDGLFTHWRIG